MTSELIANEVMMSCMVRVMEQLVQHASVVLEAGAGVQAEPPWGRQWRGARGRQKEHGACAGPPGAGSPLCSACTCPFWRPE